MRRRKLKNKKPKEKKNVVSATVDIQFSSFSKPNITKKKWSSLNTE